MNFVGALNGLFYSQKSNAFLIRCFLNTVTGAPRLDEGEGEPGSDQLKRVENAKLNKN